MSAASAEQPDDGTLNKFSAVKENTASNENLFEKQQNTTQKLMSEETMWRRKKRFNNFIKQALTA